MLTARKADISRKSSASRTPRKEANELPPLASNKSSRKIDKLEHINHEQNASKTFNVAKKPR